MVATEVWVWFLSSALFGLMHLVNALSGQAIGPTLQQVALAFGAGTMIGVAFVVRGADERIRGGATALA